MFSRGRKGIYTRLFVFAGVFYCSFGPVAHIAARAVPLPPRSRLHIGARRLSTCLPKMFEVLVDGGLSPEDENRGRRDTAMVDSLNVSVLSLCGEVLVTVLVSGESSAWELKRRALLEGV